jgi:chromosome segregation ATPase
MKTIYVLTGIVAAGLLVLGGCSDQDNPLSLMKQKEMAPPPEAPMTIQQTSENVQRRFQSGTEENTGAVQNAVMWAQRYEDMSLKNNDLREQNTKLFVENNQLKQETEKLKLKLEMTEKELAEANEFLQQMHVELNKWKSDVLGFREEMRQAQQAQLEALAKILRVLGAEPVKLPEKSS